MAKKKVMLKAETHYGKIELPMTEAKALSFSKKLFSIHKRELSNHSGTVWIKTNPWGGKRRVYHTSDKPKPFLKVEFSEI